MDVRMDGRVAVITGASTGLGLAMAKEFAASGASVALLARKQDALNAAKAEVQKAAGKANIKIPRIFMRPIWPLKNYHSRSHYQVP